MTRKSGKRKCKWLIPVAVMVLGVACVVILLRRPPEMPFNVEPLGEGIGPSTQSPKELYDRIKKSGILSYYVDRKTGKKIDLSNMELEILENRADNEWTRGDLKLRMFVAKEGGGKFQLSSVLSGHSGFESVDLVKIELKNTRFLKISPRYKWTVDPLLSVPPPGVLQDLFVTEGGVAESITEQSAISESKLKKNGKLDFSAKEKIKSEFYRTYSNAVFGSKYADLPKDVVIRTNYQVDFAKHVPIDIILSSGQQIQCTITDIDESFTPPIIFLHVPGEAATVRVLMGGYVTLKRGLLAICPIGFAPPKPGGQVRQLKVTVCELSVEKLGESPIQIEFNKPDTRYQVGSELPQRINSETDFHFQPKFMRNGQSIREPVKVNHSVVIEEGGALTIAPGTTLQFAGDCGIICNGNLTLRGDENEKIVLEAQSPVAGWANITLIGSGSKAAHERRVIIQNCEFRNGRGRILNLSDDNTVADEGLFNPGSEGEKVGGALAAVDLDSLVIENCRFQECSSTRGGAVFGRRITNLKLKNCQFVLNWASNRDRGGGGALFLAQSKLWLTDCTFENNSARGIHAAGGALYLSSSNAEVTHCIFQKNRSDYIGGVCYMHRIVRFGQTPDGMRNLLEFQSSEFIENQTFSGGGAFFVDEGCEVWLVDNKFSGNQVEIAPTVPLVSRPGARFGGSDIVVFSKWAENTPLLRNQSNLFAGAQSGQTSIVTIIPTNAPAADSSAALR